MTADAEAVPPLRVLWIEDRSDVAGSSTELLRAAGFDARTCDGGADALAAAVAFRPDLCLISPNTPEEGRDELARRLSARLEHAVLVAVTDVSDGPPSRRVTGAGFTIRLVKSADPQKLLDIVSALARAFRPRGEPG